MLSICPANRVAERGGGQAYSPKFTGKTRSRGLAETSAVLTRQSAIFDERVLNKILDVVDRRTCG
jgi:hypothetical protein